MTHTPPPDLPDEARGKWSEIVGNLDADTLTPLELDTILDYCLAHFEEQAALKLLAECPNPFIVAGDGAPYVNPLRKIIDKARDQMNRLRRDLRGKVPSAAATMGENKQELLLEIQRRHLELANIEPKYHERVAWESEMEYGPLFSPWDWFGCQGDDAARMRWQRTLAALEADGLIVSSKEDGRKWANVKLTPEGESVVEALAKENGAS